MKPAMYLPRHHAPFTQLLPEKSATLARKM